jgi:hypothetical protein
LPLSFLTRSPANTTIAPTPTLHHPPHYTTPHHIAPHRTAHHTALHHTTTALQDVKTPLLALKVDWGIMQTDYVDGFEIDEDYYDSINKLNTQELIKYTWHFHLILKTSHVISYSTVITSSVSLLVTNFCFYALKSNVF